MAHGMELAFFLFLQIIIQQLVGLSGPIAYQAALCEGVGYFAFNISCKSMNNCI